MSFGFTIGSQQDYILGDGAGDLYGGFDFFGNGISVNKQGEFDFHVGFELDLTPFVDIGEAANKYYRRPIRQCSGRPCLN